ncbi:hypothetical protein N7536_000629 [Penicillium majusculum]|nr:hypothetical protein N7536_000629 [Penicillium majusculum]
MSEKFAGDETRTENTISICCGLFILVPTTQPSGSSTKGHERPDSLTESELSLPSPVGSTRDKRPTHTAVRYTGQRRLCALLASIVANDSFGSGKPTLEAFAWAMSQ